MLKAGAKALEKELRQRAKAAAPVACERCPTLVAEFRVVSQAGKTVYVCGCCIDPTDTEVTKPK